MMAKVTKLPTPATSYTVHKVRGEWGAVLAPPCLNRPIKAVLYLFAVREDAMQKAQDVPALTERPFMGRTTT